MLQNPLNKKITTTINNKLNDIIVELTYSSNKKFEHIINQLNTIQADIAKLNSKPDHGPKPLFGYIDKKHTIPYVKLEYVVKQCMKHLKFKNSYIFRRSKQWECIKDRLKKEYKLEHKHASCSGVSGVMLVYTKIDKQRMDAILTDILGKKVR